MGRSATTMSFVVCWIIVIISVVGLKVEGVSSTQVGNCNSTLSDNTDRPGLDFAEIVNPSNNPKNCIDLCCNNTKCMAWAYAPPDYSNWKNPSSLCFLKSWIPYDRPQPTVVSGIISRPHNSTPNLPASFAAQLTFSSQNGLGSSGKTMFYYDLDSNRFGSYTFFINGTLLIEMYRYDVKKYYRVSQTVDNNTNKVVVSCQNHSLNGAVFGSDVLSLSTKYVRSGVYGRNGQAVGVFNGTLPVLGKAVYFATQSAPSTVVHIETVENQDGYEYDVIQFDAYAPIAPGIWSDYLSYC
eukprot:TRINITY_DN3202_c0_g1_i1.p1 TRINITY_DN3202_c0_g1~~TRINITY_DN3202_c0_g1_i1.p1  ORF type:complete len:296 (+),score=36.66 TRINITY_DN3202_c0_g1_i1:184-1071(+)